MRIGGSGEPSSARNRPAGKRDTTGRLHYRAPTCFLSPRRGLSPPLVHEPAPSWGASPRVAFLPCVHQPILLSDSVYTNLFRRFPLFHLGHRTQRSFSPSSAFLLSSSLSLPNRLRTFARFSVKRDDPSLDETTTFLPSNGESIRGE